MSRVLKAIEKCRFIAVMLAMMIVSEIVLTVTDPMKYCTAFARNDFELTQLAHPEKVWDKVFFGNSSVISGFMEEYSRTDYVSLGLDYGVVTDLYEMLTEGDITVDTELVIGMDWGLFYDEMDTNPTYIWHRKWYEPYLYFERDRIYTLLTDGTRRILRGQNFVDYSREGQTKGFYYGHMTAEELEERLERLDNLFFKNGTGMYANNLKALEQVFNYCKEHDIRVRCVWLPQNPDAEINEVEWAVHEMAKEVCMENEVEFYDIIDALGPECFYDTGHINYEYGAKVFTEFIDGWLEQ